MFECACVCVCVQCTHACGCCVCVSETERERVVVKHDGILLGFKPTGGRDVTFSLVYFASDPSK